MSLLLALFIYFILWILLFILCRSIHITAWSSFVFASLISIIILSLIYPVSLSMRLLNKDPLLIVYTLLQLLTIFILIFYIISSVFKDRQPVSTPDTAPFSPNSSSFSPTLSSYSPSYSSPFSPSLSPYYD